MGYRPEGGDPKVQPKPETTIGDFLYELSIVNDKLQRNEQAVIPGREKEQIQTLTQARQEMIRLISKYDDLCASLSERYNTAVNKQLQTTQTDMEALARVILEAERVFDCQRLLVRRDQLELILGEMHAAEKAKR